MIALTAVVLAACAALDAAPTLSVMSFNLWHGGDAGGRPLGRSIETIRAAGADIVGLQETHGLERDGVRPDHGPRIAEALGWHYLDQGGRVGIASRHPIVGATPRKWGAAIELEDGERIFVFNAHLPAAPYQPYQLLRIDYHDAPFLETEEELVAAARQARGGEVAALLSELRVALLSGRPVILCGDFNEPSHLDWTARAAAAGVVPMAVAWPASRAIVEAGLVDSYRGAHPDEVARPGWTWTSTTAETDPADRHDRIDRVYVSPQSLEVIACRIVGERSERADLVVAEFPSDHRAVVATVRLRARGK